MVDASPSEGRHERAGEKRSDHRGGQRMFPSTLWERQLDINTPDPLFSFNGGFFFLVARYLKIFFNTVNLGTKAKPDYFTEEVTG